MYEFSFNDRPGQWEEINEPIVRARLHLTKGPEADRVIYALRQGKVMRTEYGQIRFRDDD